MSLLKLGKVLNSRVPVGAAAFILMSNSLECAAATGPSWSQQPTWASDSRPSTSHSAGSRKPYSTEGRSKTGFFDGGNAAPFAPNSHNISLELGQVFLMGDLTKYADNIGAQLHYTYGVSDLFGFDSSLGYSDHSDGKFSLTTFHAGVRTNLAWYDKVVPYAVFGLGFYRPSYQHTIPTADGKGVASVEGVSPLLFGLHMGPGIDLELSRQLFFGAALTFNDMFGNTKITSDGKMLDVGGTFTSFFIHAGVTF